METHVKVVGWLYIILGILGILGAALLFLLIFGGGLISGDHTAINVTLIVGLVLMGVLIVLSVPGIVAGAGLLALQPWSRILALVLGILNLPSFPVGTILGVYTLYVMLDDDTSHLFAKPTA